MGAMMARQYRHAASLPIGAQARAQLSQIERLALEIDSAAALEKKNPRTIVMDGIGPRYFLSDLRYDEVATARTIPQPLLLLQGDRDWQVTVHDDVDVWLNGLHGRTGVTVVQFPNANHLFIDSAGPPNLAEYNKPGQVEPRVITAITSWISKFRATSS